MDSLVAVKVHDNQASASDAAQRRRSSVASISEIASPTGPARRRSSLVLAQASDGTPKPGEGVGQAGRRRSSVASTGGDGATQGGRRNSLVAAPPLKGPGEGAQKLLAQKKLRAAMLAGMVGAVAKAQEGEEAQGGAYAS